MLIKLSLNVKIHILSKTQKQGSKWLFFLALTKASDHFPEMLKAGILIENYTGWVDIMPLI